jgi:F-type H+-transporting ATPase subunit delta
MPSSPQRTESVMDPTSLALAGVYAQSLLEVATDDVVAEPIALELATLAALLDEIEGFRELLSPGLISEGKQCQLVQRVFAGRVSQVVEAFLAVLVHRGRGNLLKASSVAFRKRLNARQGKVEVSVTTAVELSDDQRRSLAETVRAAIGAEPLLEVKVNKDILGGLVVRVGDDVYDASLAAELKRLKRRLTGPVAA